mmetsp:Transcript_33000/g.52867  ORF Transcript_33000/g.52867 Transcript_33000/m.52867 type:complete len:311 (-) Transcript_33000:365-1297(-)
MFEPHRQPDSRLRNSVLLQHLLIHISMRHRTWMLRQRFRTTQTHRQSKHFQFIQHFKRLFLSTIHIETNHAARSFTLIPINLILFALFIQQRRIMHSLHFAMFAEKLRTLPSIFALFLHSHTQRLQTAQQQPRHKRLTHRTANRSIHRQLLKQLFLITTQRASNQITVSSQELGRRIDDHIRSILRRRLILWTEQRIIHGQIARTQRLLTVHPLSRLCDIRVDIGRIGRRLHVNQLDLVHRNLFFFNGLLDISYVIIASLHGMCLDAKLWQNQIEESIGSAIDWSRNEAMIARLQDGECQGGDGRHSTRE